MQIKFPSAVLKIIFNQFVSLFFLDFYNEGSGDHDGDRCDPENTDDEDCYYTDYDHSGYEGSGDDDTDSNPWNGHNHGITDNRNKHMGSNQPVIKNECLLNNMLKSIKKLYSGVLK